MAFLSAGVFIKEVEAAVQVIEAVSTSNMGIVGFTKQGPADVATLVTSFEQFTRVFGALTNDSFLPVSMVAYFLNGGQRAFVVRVLPADAVEADAQIQSETTDQQIETGDGVAVLYTKTALTSVLKDNAGASHLVPASFQIRYRAAAAPVVAQNTKLRDGTTNLVLVPAQANYEGRIDPTSLPTFDAALDGAIRGTVALNFSVAASAGGPAQTIPIPVGTGSIVTASIGDATNGASAIFDHRSGFFSIEMHGNFVPAGGDTGNVTADFTPASATKTIVTSGAVTTSGTILLTNASLSGGIGVNFVNVVDGSYSLTFAAGTANIPHNQARLLASYSINAWDLAPISKGVWANSVRVDVEGNDDFFDAATATFSRFNVSVLQENETTGVFELKETFDELVFDDDASDQFFPDVVNELSELISVTTPGGNEAPGQLAGVSRTQVIAGGNELTANKTITATLGNPPIAPRTLTITYTDTTGTDRTITDDGTGALTGSIDATYTATVMSVGPNRVNYTTGVVNFQTLFAINGATLVSVSYRTAPEETLHSEQFGDTAKDYSYTIGTTLFSFYLAGTDGTFDSANYGRDQFSNSALLAPSFRGLFALSKIDELMQVVIPDFAGDVTVTGDLLDYADARADLPSGGDRFIILAAPRGSDAQETVDWFRFTLNRYSQYAALYAPWINVPDPLSSGRDLLLPPLAHVAGVYARTDAARGVGKAPAGTNDGQLRFLSSLEFVFAQGDRDLLQPNKINPLRSDAQVGKAVWGARTISLESEWRYVSTRRLFMFIEKSIFVSTHWAVFESNGPALWTRLKVQVSGFLLGLFNDDLLGGNSPSDAFIVTIDESNNPPESIQQGVVNMDIAVLPKTPAEFVVFRISQRQATS